MRGAWKWEATVGPITVVTNYDPAIQFLTRVEAGNYTEFKIHLDDFDPNVNLPVMTLAGQVTYQVELDGRGDGRNVNATPANWLGYIAGLGRDFVHPFVLLTIGEVYPDLQWEQEMFTLWMDATGQTWCAVLRVGGFKRLFGITRVESLPQEQYVLSAGYHAVTVGR